MNQTYRMLLNALDEIGIEYSHNDLELCKVGDPSSCLRFLHFLKRSYEQSVNRKIAPSAEIICIQDLKEIKKDEVEVIDANEESVTDSDYSISEVFKTIDNVIEFFQNSIKMDFDEISIFFVRYSKC